MHKGNKRYLKDVTDWVSSGLGTDNPSLIRGKSKFPATKTLTPRGPTPSPRPFLAKSALKQGHSTRFLLFVHQDLWESLASALLLICNLGITWFHSDSKWQDFSLKTRWASVSGKGWQGEASLSQLTSEISYVSLLFSDCLHCPWVRRSKFLVVFLLAVS